MITDAVVRKSLRVLVVEDDLGVLEFLKACLSRAKHVVFAASNVRDASRALNSMPFDVVVTDMALPDGDGLEVMRVARSAVPPPRIVAVSGGGIFLEADYYAKVARVSGANVFLAKPFSAEDILRVIDA